MPVIVPLVINANQIVTVSLGNQNCQLNVYQTDYGLFLDVLVDNAMVVGGVLCENLNRIVRDLYLGFAGDFTFVDTQGTSDPNYTGLGVRYFLVYLTVADLPAGVG